MIYGKFEAIRSLKPDAHFAVRGDAVEWLDDNPTNPTEAEITAEVSRLQAEYEANEYQRKRASAYPSIADQLDQIFHEGIDAWKATIQSVKDTYPKGGS